MGDPATAADTPAAMSFLAPLALQTRWACNSVVGRTTEHTAIRQEMAAARNGRLAGLTFEGEPGIGKSRLLVAAAEAARDAGFAVLAATADEELRGPFLLARSLLAAREVQETSGEATRTAFARTLDAMAGNDAAELAQLTPDRKALRVLDLAAVAIRALAEEGPVALLVDDAQWADHDSIRLLRYVVRAVEDMPVFLALSLRPDEAALDAELGALLADMQRLGLLRRLHLGRFTQGESTDLLTQVLGGTLAPATAATMHAQAEGVPFILEELARSYRDGGVLQQIEGVWRLGPKVERLLPSAVRTLIQRRAAHLPEEARTVLAEAAVIGRAFSLKDVQAVRQLLGDDDRDGPDALADALSTAVAAGFLVELPDTSPADYRFTHEHVREFAASSLATPRRRAIHTAIVELLTRDGQPPPESLPMLAQHALAAGDSERAAEFACQAARAALAARAPDEVLRIVDLALAASVRPQDRVTLLRSRDDALDMLRRPVERLENLAELGALAEALADRTLLFDTTLRRAAALRLLEDEERAATLAVEVRREAEAAGDTATALAASLEEGQALMRKPLGESFSPDASADLAGAEAAFEDALRLAEQLGDVGRQAAAHRELGVIGVGRARQWYVESQRRGDHLPWLERIAAGERVEVVMLDAPIGPVMEVAQEHFSRAVELFDSIGDRRGLMSSIIAMAYVPFALDIHLHGSAKRIEEIHRLATQLAALATESGRDHGEAQMLYGAHVFARAKAVADLAIARGVDAYDKSRMIGDTGLEMAAAGGTAMAYLDLGELPPAQLWLDRAAAAAAVAPMPYRTRQLALWRGICSATAGDGDRMLAELERAVALATEQGLPAARCESLARLALEATKLGIRLRDASLLNAGREAAAQVDDLAASLPGRHLWGAQAVAARVLDALQRGEPAEAAERARQVLTALQAAVTEDMNLEILLPAARGLLAGGEPEEQGMIAHRLRLTLALISQRIVDEEIRVRWFHGPVGRELRDLVGVAPEITAPQAEEASAAAFDDDELALLGMLVDGYTNRQIAEALDLDLAEVAALLARFYAKIGTSSRAETTAFAFRERVI